MFKFIKKLFANDNKKEEEIILKKDELANFINKKINEKENDFNKLLKLKISDFKFKINEIKEKLDNLSKLELMNKNITTKEIQYMQGNRKLFITNVNTFINNMDLDINCDLFLEKFEKFNQNEKRFIKNLQRCMMILSHFFVNETQNIMRDIAFIKKELDKLNEKYNKLNLNEFKEIIENIENYEAKQKEKIIVNKKITTKKKELKELKAKIQNNDNEIHIIENSKEYHVFKEDLEKNEKLKNELENLKKDLSNEFLPLSQALKKYQRTALNPKIVDETINSPIDSLINNKSNEISDMLLKLKTQIEKSSIELKDKKKDKAISTINKLNISYLESFFKNYNKIKKDFDDNNQKILNHNINIKKNKLEDIKIKLENNNNNVEFEINELNKEIVKLTDDNFYKNTQEKLNKIIENKIIID
jgi:hypothetical protein